MGTLLGVHPIVPWLFQGTPRSYIYSHQTILLQIVRKEVLPGTALWHVHVLSMSVFHCLFGFVALSPASVLVLYIYIFWISCLVSFANITILPTKSVIIYIWINMAYSQIHLLSTSASVVNIYTSQNRLIIYKPDNLISSISASNTHPKFNSSPWKMIAGRRSGFLFGFG